MQESRLHLAIPYFHCFTRAVIWCSKVYSVDDIQYMMECIETLFNTRWPEAGRELMAFLEAVN